MHYAGAALWSNHLVRTTNLPRGRKQFKYMQKIQSSSISNLLTQLGMYIYTHGGEIRCILMDKKRFNDSFVFKLIYLKYVCDITEYFYEYMHTSISTLTAS